MKTWTQAKFDHLCEMAATGAFASDIAAVLGTSHHSVVTMAGRNSIPINRYTPAEQAEMDRRYREAEVRKNARRRAATAAKRPDRTIVPRLPSQIKTSPEYRNCLPKIPEMSKSALRAMLADAVRNTAEMQA